MRHSKHQGSAPSLHVGCVILHTKVLRLPYTSGASFYTPRFCAFHTCRMRHSTHQGSAPSLHVGCVILHTKVLRLPYTSDASFYTQRFCAFPTRRAL
ncbi:hypothetical protein BaRGS_00022033 [Batillaria attramentaria]|uniref:Uncharacterized protein n=1 Tax=Batillaria attramentaria TaxID=370345 RepID=A0ABD0KHW0_9CAEN